MKVTLPESIIDEIEMETSPYKNNYVLVLLKPSNDEMANNFKTFVLSKFIH